MTALGLLGAIVVRVAEEGAKQIGDYIVSKGEEFIKAKAQEGPDGIHSAIKAYSLNRPALKVISNLQSDVGREARIYNLVGKAKSKFWGMVARGPRGEGQTHWMFRKKINIFTGKKMSLRTRKLKKHQSIRGNYIVSSLKRKSKKFRVFRKKIISLY